MTTSLGIAPPPCPHSWPTVLVLLFGTPEEAVFKGVPLFPSVISVCQGQGCPRQYILAVWTFLVHPQTFFPPRRGPWAWYEMERGRQILWPNNSPSKSYCSTPRVGRRILMFSGLCHGRSSLVPLWAPGPLRLPKARSWRFGVRGALSLILLWDDTDCFGIRGAHSMALLWSGADLTVEGSLGNWAGFISLRTPSLSFVRDKFPPDFAFYIRRPRRTILLHLQAPKSYRNSKFSHFHEPRMPLKLWASQLR